MQKYRDNVTIVGRGGLVPVRNATATVYVHGTTSKAVIYTNAQRTPKANPFQADSLGVVAFYAENGHYDILVQGEGQEIKLTDVLMEDVYEDVDALNVQVPMVLGIAEQARDVAEAAVPLAQLSDGDSLAYGANMVGYRGNYTAKAKLGETVSAEEYRSASDDSESESIQRALDAVGDGGTVLMTKANYDLLDQVEIFNDNVSIVAPNGTTVRVGLPPSSSDGQFRLRGFGPHAGQTTEVVADIARGDTVIQVNNAADLDVGRGDYLILRSNEYFNGIAGMSGFGVENKAEWMQVISVSGNAITILGGAKDSYTLALGSATVQKCTLSRRLRMQGIEAIGTGGGNSHTGGTPVGPLLLTASYVDGLSLDSVYTRNFPRIAIQVMRGMNGMVSNYRQLGYDTDDGTNFPNLSSWFTGVNAQGWENLILSGGQAKNSRRILDADSTWCVSRNIMVANIQAFNCHNLVGCHVADTFSAYNVQGMMCGAVSSRATNTILDGISNVQNRGSFAVHIGHVGNVDRAYPEQVNAGKVKIKNVSSVGSYDYGIGVLANCEDLQVSGVYLPDASSGTGVILQGKRFGNINIQGTIKGRVNMTSQASMPCETAGSIRLAIDFIDGGAAECVRIAGTTDTDSNLNVSIDKCVFAGASSYAVTFGPYSSEVGYFPRSPLVGSDNIYMHAGLSNTTSPVRTQRYPGPAPIVSGFTGVRVSPRQWGQVQNSSQSLVNGTYYPGAQIDYQSFPGGGGGYVGRFVRVAGTIGTLTGVTASTTSGSSTITVSDASDLCIGAYIAVAGAQTLARITGISGNTVSTTQSATATVSGATVSFAPPVIEQHSPIQP